MVSRRNSSSRRSRKDLPPADDAEVSQVTARPMHVAERHANEPDLGEGLSIDPEEMGPQFLRDAIEQGDAFHGTVPDLSITGPAASDNVAASSSGRATLWDVTVDRAANLGRARKQRPR